MNWNIAEIFENVKKILGEDFEGAFGVNFEEYRFTGVDIHGFKVFMDKNLTKEFGETTGIRTSWGATKVVLIPADTDYVIKIPITGFYNVDFGISLDDIKGIHFKGFIDLDDFDAMRRENFTREYLWNDVKNIFLPDILIGQINGIPIYIQKKVASIAKYTHSSVSNEDKEFIKRLTEETGYIYEVDFEIDARFLSTILHFYNEETVRKFLGEIKMIGDLHAGNYGYLADGSPVVFDYASYEEDMYLDYIEA